MVTKLVFATLADTVKELSKDGVFGGNETLVAFSRLRSVDIVIHQLDEKPWIIEANPGVAAKVAIHLAYHNEEDHYSSVVPALQGEDKRPQPVKIQSHVSVQSREKSAKTVRPTHHEEDYSSKDTKPRPTNKIDNSDLPQPNKFSTVGGSNALPDFDDLYIQVQLATGCQDSITICQALEDNNWDTTSALVQVLQIMSLGEDSNIPVAVRVSPVDVEDVLQDLGSHKAVDVVLPKEKPEQHHPNAKSYSNKKQQGAQVTLSNKKRKELAKVERKTRRLDAQKKDKPDNGGKPPTYFEDDFDRDFGGLAI